MGRWDRAPSVFEIEVEREGLEYAVGDCTLLVRNDHIDSRPYSFSSHPDEPALRFLVRSIAGIPASQSFSQWLASLREGDEMHVGTPFGWFRPGQTSREVWFATGTGLSPFLAALRGRQVVPPLALCVGARSPADAVLRSWLEEKSPVWWAFSRESDQGWEPRRVTDLASQVPTDGDIRYFLCGNQRMIRDVSRVLVDRGVSSRQIHEELFFQ